MNEFLNHFLDQSLFKSPNLPPGKMEIVVRINERLEEPKSMQK